MKLSSLLLVTSASLPATSAWPAMKQQLNAVLARAPQAAEDDVNTRMIGDLKNGATTAVGKSIQNILLKKESAQSKATYMPPLLAFSGSAACKKDTCELESIPFLNLARWDPSLTHFPLTGCQWFYVSQAMTAYFTGLISFNGLPTVNCNDAARAAIRLAFHDAGTWSSTGSDFGGADGSIVLAASEIGRADNRGLQSIAKQMISWQKQFGVGMADLIQFAAAHAVVTCPLGPRMRVWVGRKDSSVPAPEGLLPDARASAESLINLFEDKTISPHELVALLGAHGNSKQRFFDASKAGAPQDSSPGTWDTLYYNQTVDGSGGDVLVRFPSDVALAEHPKCKDEWTEFRKKDAQGHWNEDYAAANTRLSLLGVNNINQLKECSGVLPPVKPLGIAIVPSRNSI
ncbi:Cytochrome c peroxidase, mitochondrial [Sphaceloma murrayae]|uniref:Peroxidase n=1 Tax=Sphaceloma murrayae TaxID=2082308 RepID=A0A2K1QHP1_9PEZI|nr:Cytochrome c peroxidase, mitochondrial [Sphaceloma murrayae]